MIAIRDAQQHSHDERLLPVLFLALGGSVGIFSFVSNLVPSLAAEVPVRRRLSRGHSRVFSASAYPCALNLVDIELQLAYTGLPAYHGGLGCLDRNQDWQRCVCVLADLTPSRGNMLKHILASQLWSRGSMSI